MFAASTVEKTNQTTHQTVKPKFGTIADAQSRLTGEAARLRQEAAEMEIAMREEARQKGLPEEVINKLIPMRTQTPAVAPVPVVVSSSDGTPTTSSSSSSVTATTESEAAGGSSKRYSKEEVLGKIGFLSMGNPIQFTNEINDLAARRYTSIWNSYDLGNRPSFQLNSYQLTSKTGIDPKDLQLDGVGYNYQNVLVIAVIIGTVCGLASSYIGGQIGFLLGYLSALIPVTLVAIGSVAPALIGDVLNRSKFLVDEEARNRYAKFNAGRFLVGYTLGLPVNLFYSGGASSTVEFFQLRAPVLNKAAGADGGEARDYYSKKRFKQVDVAPFSIVCLAGSVAECMEFKKASTYSAADVNVLNEVLLTVEPVMEPEGAQNHIKWSALQAFNILTKHKVELDLLTEAFKRGATLEESIAIIEGK